MHTTTETIIDSSGSTHNTSSNKTDATPPKPHFSKLRAFFWPIYSYELKKLVPMFGLFFLISFVFNVLRVMKISVMVTSKGAGAEVVPFLKLFAVLFSTLISMRIQIETNVLILEQ